ncbi:MAG: DUF1385 domain-containing protein [Candidatus Krumholzibacteria bacterium]|nr:DUF1385 domain-containing protein [Candidatus Krumholzibacteria bacterium]
MSEQDERKRLQVGGQAVIEGVMMRSPGCIATAVRTPSGAIVLQKQCFTSLTRRFRALNVPIIRGAIAFVETFVIAIRALSFSAEKATAEAAAEGGGTGAADAGKGLSSFSIFITIAAAFALGFGLFFYLPLFLTELTGLTQGVLFNLVDGVIRLIFLILYIVLITRWKEMRRIFEYHGAEHKTISAFEAEGTATVENTRAYSTLHARCSTSFLLIVVVVSIIIFMFLGRPQSIGDKLIRFAFIPVIGGVSYELLKISAKPGLRRYMAVFVWPGLFLQKLTTKEPSSDQIEVAIAALNACLGDKIVES